MRAGEPATGRGSPTAGRPGAREGPGFLRAPGLTNGSGLINGGGRVNGGRVNGSGMVNGRGQVNGSGMVNGRGRVNGSGTANGQGGVNGSSPHAGGLTNGSSMAFVDSMRARRRALARRSAAVLAVLLALVGFGGPLLYVALFEPSPIVVDGDFSDWAAIPVLPDSPS